ncbi:MAG: cytochrome c [Sphingomonas bacterium]|nr:cytochrome c [Sphingomonas bacterium]
MRALLGLAAACAAFVTLAPSGAALAGGDDGNPVIGRAIFVRDNCAGCHGTFGGGGMGPNLRDNQPNDDAVRNAVLNGMPTGMPSYRNLLNDNDVGHLVAYLDTLERDEEPVSTHWWEFIPSHFPDQVRCCAPPSEPPHTTP